MPTLDTIKLIAALVGAALIALTATIITHKVDQAALLKIEAGYKDAQIAAISQAKAVQAAEDKVSLDAAVAEATAQQKIVTITNTVTREVPNHVPLTSKCAVTVGFVRVLNAVILGNVTSDVSYAPGKSDDACASLDARALAGSIIGNYAAALANGEQLAALQKWVTDTIAASKSK